MSDPVLVREDGTYLYTLPSVVDDIDLAITHVIRGEDHVSNTGTQIEIIEALGGQIPMFAHHNLLTDAAGQGLLQAPWLPVDHRFPRRRLRAAGDCHHGLDHRHQPADRALWLTR